MNTDINDAEYEKMLSAAGNDDLNVSSLIPKKHDGYVPFGFYKDLSMIIGSNMFFPIYLSGESGFGKTLMVYQTCHERQRELIRVQISPETDKTSLMYVPKLDNGNLTYELGPVPQAMERGAILLLDEIDRGTDKLICLNGIMEGKPWFNEKTQKLIHPKPGFNVIATGNSKGQGSSNSSYLVRILDGAFLERFPITVDHEYPTIDHETKILKNALDIFGIPDEEFALCLAKWANFIRKTKDDGNEEIEIVSTRRLVDMCQAYKIWNGNRKKAVSMCLSRFPDNVKKALLQQYNLIDANHNISYGSKQTLKIGELFNPVMVDSSIPI